MLSKMTRAEFDSIENARLVEVCFEPMIPIIRGKDIKVKTDFYKKLNTSQQALFMFNAYYNHANKSLEEFYWWSAYYYAQPNAWKEIKAGLHYFNANKMLELLERIEEKLRENDFPNSLEKFNISYKDLTADNELHGKISSLNEIFHNISPETKETIGKYIRNHPDTFIVIA